MKFSYRCCFDTLSLILELSSERKRLCRKKKELYSTRLEMISESGAYYIQFLCSVTPCPPAVSLCHGHQKFCSTRASRGRWNLESNYESVGHPGHSSTQMWQCVRSVFVNWSEENHLRSSNTIPVVSRIYTLFSETSQRFFLGTKR